MPLVVGEDRVGGPLRMSRMRLKEVGEEREDCSRELAQCDGLD